MRWALVSVALLFVARSAVVRAAPVPPTPASAFALAAADIVKVDASLQAYTRYLWFPESDDPKVLDLDRRALSFHVNSLSTGPVVVPFYEETAIVPGSGGRLVRINTEDYGHNFLKAWETLATAAPNEVEPHFHVLIQKEVEWGYYEDSYGRHYNPDQLSEQQRQGMRWVKTETKSSVVPAIAPWLTETAAQKEAVATLVKYTQSSVPVVRGDWFLFQTAADLDRKPGYHDFLGFNSQKDFEKLIGFDREAAKKFPLELADAVRISRVARGGKPRAVLRYGKPGGGYWLTQDVEVPTNQSNPLRVFDPAANLVVTAQEAIGQGLNGMLYFGLFNAQGARQDVAPQGVVMDRLGGANDFNIHEGSMDCIRCHAVAEGKDGLADIKAWVRGHLNRPPLALGAAQQKEGAISRERLQQIYQSDLAGGLEDDRRIAARACKLATGLDYKLAAKAVADLWDRYTDTPVGIDRAARDLGTDSETLKKALNGLLKNSGSLDPVLTAYVRPGALNNGPELLAASYLEDDGPLPLQIDVWHECLPLAHLALRGLVAAQETKQVYP